MVGAKSLPQRYPPRSSLGRLRCGTRNRSAGTAPRRTEDGSAGLGRAHGRPAATVERGGFSDATWTQSVYRGCLVGHGVWRRGHTGRRRGFGSDVGGVVRRRRGLVKRAVERDGLLRCLAWIANVRGRSGDVRRRGRGGADASDDGDARYGCRCPPAASRPGGDAVQQWRPGGWWRRRCRRRGERRTRIVQRLRRRDVQRRELLCLLCVPSGDMRMSGTFIDFRRLRWLPGLSDVDPAAFRGVRIPAMNGPAWIHVGY